MDEYANIFSPLLFGLLQCVQQHEHKSTFVLTNDQMVEIFSYFTEIVSKTIAEGICKNIEKNKESQSTRITSRLSQTLVDCQRVQSNCFQEKNDLKTKLENEFKKVVLENLLTLQSGKNMWN